MGLLNVEKQLFFSLVTLIAIFKWTHARSVHGLVFRDDDLTPYRDYNEISTEPKGNLMLNTRPEDENPDVGSAELWQPVNGSRDQWMQYHGMSRDKWLNIVDKLRRIEQFDQPGPQGLQHATNNNQQYASPFSTKSDSSRVLLQKESPGLDSVGGGLSARVEEGCLWYTEEQVDEFLTDRGVSVPDPLGTNVASSTEPCQNENANDESGSGEIQRDQDVDQKINHRKKRKIEDMEDRPERKWHNPIIYKFDGGHSKLERAIIRNAIQQWENHTCLKFFEINHKAPITQQHLLFTKHIYGCYSFVGKIEEIPQQINLAPACLSQFGIAVHEIGHALGLWHEQQRHDRDEWITVNSENIGYYSSQFWKRKTVSLGVPYDYGSVMHYARRAGSKNTAPTMSPLDPLYASAMGQRAELSYMDAKIINMEYCRGQCPGHSAIECERGGYRDPDRCGHCICPDGFGGKYCQDHAPPVNAECGGVIELGHENLAIESPGYSQSESYDDFTECSWIIKAPTDHKVKLTFDDADFGVFCKFSETCFHWVEVKYKTDFEYPGPRFCCYQTPEIKNLISETNEMAVVFKSNFATQHKSARRGFRALLETVSSDGMELTTETEVFVMTTEAPVTVTSTEPSGTHWGDWSDTCSNHECQCGGCSSRIRTRMCGSEPCRDDNAATETKSCDIRCGTEDRFLQWTGTFIKAHCPVCCKGFSLVGDICEPSKDGS